MKRVVLPLLAWVLWMDQTVYTMPAGPGDTTPRAVETARSHFMQLDVTTTREQCEVIRQARVREAIQADDAEDAASGRRTRYRARYRYFCSPAVEETTR